MNNPWKNKILRLSFELSETTPGFGGAQDFQREKLGNISTGSSSNSERWTFKNHIGTHVDAPFHFCKDGKTIDQYDPSFWFFSKPFLWNKPLKHSELLTGGDFNEPFPVDTDILLIKTGFEVFRSQPDYWENNPGISPEVSDVLRKNYPRLRMIGFDFISLTAYQKRDVGRAAHRSFLGNEKGNHPLLILEDVKLSELHVSPEWVVVSPLVVEGADGSPVTVFAGV